MEYEIPEEIKNIYREMIAMADLRDKYIKKIGGYNNAVKAAKEVIKLKRKFWNSIRELYPDMVDRIKSYNEKEGFRFIDEK